MLITCNECKDAFEIEEAKVRTEKREGGLGIGIFNCPECGYAYVFNIKNDETSELNKQLREEKRRLHRAIEEGKDVKEREEKIGRIKKMTMERVKQLREEYQKKENGTKK